VQWALVTLEIHVSELAATNGLLEDLHSFMLNVVSLVMQFNLPDFETSPQFYVSFGALLVSCITGGRKTYLRDKLKALRAKKGELEAETKKMSGGRGSIIVGGSLKMIGQLDVEGGEVRGRQGCQGCAVDWRRRDQCGGGGERRTEDCEVGEGEGGGGGAREGSTRGARGA